MELEPVEVTDGVQRKGEGVPRGDLLFLYVDLYDELFGDHRLL